MLKEGLEPQPRSVGGTRALPADRVGEATDPETCAPASPAGYDRRMDENRVQENDEGVRELIEVRRPEAPRGVTFEWHIKQAPRDSSEGEALRADQAEAIRGLLERLSDQRLHGDRPASDNGVDLRHARQ